MTLEELNQKLEPYWYEGMPGVYRVPAIGEGWFQLVFDLVDDLEELWPDFKITQIKEKFGGLRFYVETYKKDYVGQPAIESAFYQRIAKAEAESYTICEVCGKPGKLREDLSWNLTLCDEDYRTDDECNHTDEEDTKAP